MATFKKYGPVPCFLLEPTDQQQRWARRYKISVKNDECPKHDYHNAMVLIDTVPAIFEQSSVMRLPAQELDPAAPFWPTQCECGYVFGPDDIRQTFTQLLYRRSDNGEFTTLRDAPPGAMWYADWMNDWRSGPDGRCLVVKCPNGREWMIDSMASNCDMPKDDQHRCWIRHGAPPLITVDKKGKTCKAGAGSIMAGDYHGHLVNGVFQDC